MKMNLRSVIAISLSLVVGVGLIVLLLLASRVRWQDILSRSLAVDRMAFVRLCLLFALNSFLSSEKWRMTDRVVSQGGGKPLPRPTAFGLTAIGVALGQFLPIQISMSIARTLGTLVYGRALRRGTVATLFEQAFDFFVAILMMLASVCAGLLQGGGVVWLAYALAGALLGVSCVGSLMKLANRLAARLTVQATHAAGWRRSLAELQQSGLFHANLARPLTLISFARFAVLVLIASQVSSGVHIAIPLWRLGAAVPFGLMAGVVGITPGGLGLTEAAYATFFKLSGLSLALSTQWAIANRLLATAAIFIVGGGRGHDSGRQQSLREVTHPQGGKRCTGVERASSAK
jgi:uncharacterized membrane protein YbhN (UPF0104 family)